jgi:hypothetical protein
MQFFLEGAEIFRTLDSSTQRLGKEHVLESALKGGFKEQAIHLSRNPKPPVHVTSHNEAGI